MITAKPFALPELKLFISFIILYIKSPCPPPFVTLFLSNELIYFIRLKITLQISAVNSVWGDFGLNFGFVRPFWAGI
jgi:hypothetical protein